MMLHCGHKLKKQVRLIIIFYLLYAVFQSKRLIVLDPTATLAK